MKEKNIGWFFETIAYGLMYLFMIILQLIFYCIVRIFDRTLNFIHIGVENIKDKIHSLK